MERIKLKNKYKIKGLKESSLEEGYHGKAKVLDIIKNNDNDSYMIGYQTPYGFMIDSEVTMQRGQQSRLNDLKVGTEYNDIFIGYTTYPIIRDIGMNTLQEEIEKTTSKYEDKGLIDIDKITTVGIKYQGETKVLEKYDFDENTIVLVNKLDTNLFSISLGTSNKNLELDFENINTGDRFKDVQLDSWNGIVVKDIGMKDNHLSTTQNFNPQIQNQESISIKKKKELGLKL